jgi:hydroxyacylglutathione hydrolase
MQPFIKIALSQANCYLLKTKQGYLLIDCGSRGYERSFRLKLQKLGISLASIHWLLLTHHHSDHCGLLPCLLSENPAIRIIMSQKCAEYLETGSHFHPSTEIYSSKVFKCAFKLYGLAGGKLTDIFPPYFRREGDVIFQGESMLLPDSAGISGRILHTPGHTDDSISLVVGEDVFVGDAASNMPGFPGAPYEPILLYNRGICLESWNKLLSLEVRRVHPGHGKSFDIRCLQKGN